MSLTFSPARTDLSSMEEIYQKISYCNETICNSNRIEIGNSFSFEENLLESNEFVVVILQIFALCSRCQAPQVCCIYRSWKLNLDQDWEDRRAEAERFSILLALAETKRQFSRKTNLHDFFSKNEPQFVKDRPNVRHRWVNCRIFRVEL